MNLMISSSDLAVAAEPDEPPPIDALLVRAVLNQVMESLAQFLDSGASAAIDLRRMPRMDAATYQHLKDTLSTGEVSATVTADVTVDIRETRYPGVWWLTHRNERGGIVTELIEITEVPGILKSHVADMRAGWQRLEQALASSSPQQGTPATG